MFVTGSLVHGGAERHSITLMNRLAERGHECHAVYVKNDPSQLVRIRLGKGGSVLCLDAARFMDTSAVRRFGAHIAAVRPSVVVAANGYALMYSALALALSGWNAPLVATFHTTQVLGLKEHVKAVIDRLFFWRASRTIFVCENQRRYWLKRGLLSRSNEVIYNGVDTAHFSLPEAGARQLTRSRLGIPETDYLIGISAVMRPEKNHVQLVDALARLRSQGIPARVLMIGDGPTRGEVETRAGELGVSRSVVITGLEQDVRDFVRACDVMVLCSRAVETFSLAALEAMAMGRPVVHAELGGASEMVLPGENGYLFPVGDTSALVGCLARLSDGGESGRMGARARQLVEERFSERSMVDSYERMLAELCSPESCAGSRSALRSPSAVHPD
jgi:glycosyltransferase involved in cell wall biosynthesis